MLEDAEVLLEYMDLLSFASNMKGDVSNHDRFSSSCLS